jgi:hypothetical protein
VLDSSGESAAILDDAESLVLTPIQDLARDPRLLMTWKRAGGSGRPVRGIVQVEEDDASVIVIALDPELPPLVDIDLLVAQAFPSEDVVVLPSSRSLLDWVIALVRARAPGVDELEPVWTLEQRGDRLHLLVGSRNSRAGVRATPDLDFATPLNLCRRAWPGTSARASCSPQ